MRPTIYDIMKYGYAQEIGELDEVLISDNATTELRS
jgi:hypothetical protein